MSAGRRALPLLLVLALFLGPFQAKADHYSGGSITYECLGANFYEITLDLYLDCSGAPLTPQNLQLSNDCGVNFTLNSIPLVLTEEVSQLCPSSLANSTCNGGFLQGIRHYQFVTTVFLSPCNDWTIAWNICCRSAVQNLIGTQGMYLEATVNNAGGACDNSPIIAENSIPFVCVNDPIVYSPGISDPDGNTMFFQLISAQFSAPAPTNINYQPGFTAGSPIPGITLDPATGQLNFTPTVTGSYVVVLEVTTFDASGVPIGTVMRDFLFIVQNCATTPPVSTGLTNGTNAFIVSAGAVEVCDGVPFCVDIPFTDADLGSSIALTSNAAALLPGATFTVIGSNPVIGRLCWTPDPAFSPANIQVVANDDSCPVPNEASFSILVTVVQPPPVPPDAGTNGTVSACPGSPPVALFPALGGSPDLGGVWTDPDGNVHNGIFTPPGDVFGTYIYRVGNGCAFDEASINVSATGGQDPGTNGTLDLCSNGASVALITGLGGTPQAGGAWSGPSPVVAGNYNPATMAPGVYTYTVPGVAPCPAASATVTVTESAAPNAGTNGTRSVCSNGAAVSLMASLGGTPAAGGTWSGPSPVVGGNYNPATMNPGVYTYTVTGTAPCANATATVTVTENTLPNAGTNGTLTVCSNGASVSLIGSLGGTPAAGGTWSGPSAVVGGNYNPATMAPGVYTYTVTGIAPCANATATVTVTENAAPNAGTNGTLTICSNGAAVSLISSLGGTPAAGGTWSGPSAVVGGNYDPATMAPGVYTYTVTGTAPCANATATVTVTENAAPNAGTNGSLTICSNGAAVALISSLGGTPAAGGTWSGPSAVVGGNYDPAAMAPGVYTYTVTGVAPCANATATVTVTENAAPNAGTNGTLTICSNGAAVSLNSSLGGTPAAGGTWSGPSAVVGGNYDPATMAPGVYTYTVTGTAPCANATATVTVTENAAPNAGTNGSLTICSNGAVVALISSLGGTPAAGGAWSGPSAVAGGNYDPATMAPGVYTYTVTGTAPCANATATVTVTENAAPNAGTNGTLTICSNGAAVALISSLGGTPAAGGTWSGPSAVVGGNYDPATMAPGVYTYTVTGTAPCANATATVTVTENAAPNAGTNGSLTICSNGAAVALISSLGGTPAAGGTWSGPSAVVGGNYDPATMDAGVYTYTVTGVAPCANSTATVTVTENAAPNAGTNGTLTICSNGAAVSLISSLGGTPAAGGTWSGPSAVVGGNYDPATMAPGVYTYTVTGTAPCANATATVTVTENAAPNAGTNGSLTICSNGAAVALISSLGGTPAAGGTWSGPSAVVGGNYDPATMAPGVYTYTVTGTAPCANATATVTVTENAAPNAGTNGTLTICSNGAAVSLINSLGGTPAAGGTWSGPSAVVGGNYDPATMAPGVYTYTVTGTAPCANATATVTVTENAAPNAGTNGTVTICSNGAAAALISSLGGIPAAGGTWSGPSAVVGGNYDPATMDAGVYTYTVTGVAPCANATATVTVTENAAPNAGTNGTLTICSNGAAVSLVSSLGGTPAAGGTWSGPSAVVGGNYDPAAMAPGVYTYTVTGVAPCANATATVTVTENATPNAGTNGTLTICSNGGATALISSLGGTPAAGGTWSGPSAVVGGNYDPSTMDAGVYTYTVTGVAPCVNATATVTVTENAAPNAGTNGTLTVCSNGASVSLISALGGTPAAGGAWSGPSAVVGGNYDPATMDAGVYTYTVTGIAPCANATATVTVTENAAPNAGTNGTLTVCSSGASLSLISALGGTPAAGGTWSGPSAVVGGNYDPATMDAGVYTYTVTGLVPCVSAIATVTVAENTAPSAGANSSLTVCETGSAVSLVASLGGTPDAGGAWSGPSAVVGGNYDPTTMTPGVYTYTVTGTAPCSNATATVSVAETGSPDAGTDGAVTVCGSGASIDLFTQLGGTPDAGGTWSGPSAVVGSTYDPSTMSAGVYTYTLNATAPCVADQSTVTVTENAAADAGTNGTLTVCETGGAVGLIASLGGTPDAGGAWSGPSAVVGGNYDPATMTPGVYTYTVMGTAPCSNAAATVTVAETGSPDAGTDGAVTVCGSGASIDLFTQLGGTPDAGGTWSGPSAVVGSTYDPSTMSAGVYTYTLNATAPCVADQSTVTVTESAAADAGTNGTLTVCETGGAVGLFASLGGTPDAGGTWSGPSAVVGGNYDPTTMTPGVYTYTVTGTAPCSNATATVSVAETGSPDAGTDGAVTVCGSGASIDLFTQLGGTPDAGGTWSGPSAVVGSTYDPSTMSAGVYTYTLNATAPCVADQSTVTVTENAAADAGTNGTLTVCETGGAVGLIASLGGTPDAGGTWSGPSAVVGGNYDPTTMTPGVYTYTVTGTAPCTNATATVSVAETGSPDAGTDGAVTVCESGSAIELFTQLGGTPDAGGTWSGPSAVVGGQYDPTNMTAGVYTYTLNATAPCVADQSTVTVTENAAADAGTNGTLTVCETGGAVGLIASLGGTPDAGGAWSGPSAVVGGNYDPATMTPGVYTFTVTGTAPCTNATATVTVAETGSPDAGTDGAITVCESGSAIDLFTQLGGTPDAGGTWSGPSAVVGSTYDPSTMSAGVYTYTLMATAPCPSASATIDVVEDPAQNAGNDATLTLCASSGEQQLFDLLGPAAEVGGNWSGPAGSFSGTFDPSTDPSGTYTYTFTATACPSDQATIQVTVEEGANAGGDASLILCSTNAPIALIDQLEGTPDATGTWTNEDGDVVPAILDPSSSVGGEFIYTVPASDDCPADQAVLTVIVNTAPVAGTSGSLAICAASTPVSLFDGLTGTLDAGGTWTAPDGSAHATVIDPSVDISGIYTYTVTALAPCSDASANVNVFIAPVPDAGADATTVQCSSAGAFIMTELLAGTPEPDGVWRGPSGDVVPAAFAPESGSPGIYTYTVAAIAPCVDDVSQLTISISEAVSAGTNGTVTTCANSDTTVDLFQALGGTPDPDGSWTAPNGDPFNGVFDPLSDEAGIYTYSVTATAPCPSVSAGVVVDIVPLPTAEFVVEGAEACTPVTITLSTTFQGGVSCSWLLWNGEQVNDCAPVTRTITDGGTYGATLIVDAGNGCGTDTLSVPELFTVFDRPTADFTYVPEVINTLAPDVLFNNGSENAIGYTWDIAGDTLTTEDAAYSFAAGVSGEYLVCLTAIASEACRDSICKVVAVEDGLLVHVPNAFTPDGVAPNDIFKPIMLGVEPSSYRFYIFDRWGQPLFETSDPEQGWNGLFADGTEVPIGVYVWKLVAKDRITTNRIERVGHVTLVR